MGPHIYPQAPKEHASGGARVSDGGLVELYTLWWLWGSGWEGSFIKRRLWINERVFTGS